MTHMDRMLLSDQVVRLGRQTACGRFAHLMLELHERLDRVGLAEAGRFRSYVATATSAVFATRLSRPTLLAIDMSGEG